MTFLHLTLFGAIFLASAHVRLHVLLARSFILCPCGFQSRAFLVTFSASFLRVCPIHPHFLLLMSFHIGPFCVLLHRSSFEITGGLHIPRIYRSFLLTGAWILFPRDLVMHQVSEPYRRTDLIFVLKILSFAFKIAKAWFDFLIHAAVSSSVPPVVLATLRR